MKSYVRIFQLFCIFLNEVHCEFTPEDFSTHDDHIKNYRHGFQDTFDTSGLSDHMNNYRHGPESVKLNQNPRQINQDWDHYR